MTQCSTMEEALTASQASEKNLQAATHPLKLNPSASDLHPHTSSLHACAPLF
jgi:hypothetical protein